MERIVHRDVIEASELGLPPGSWPTEMGYRGYEWHMLYQQTTENPEEIIAVTYIRNDCSYELLDVLND